MKIEKIILIFCFLILIFGSIYTVIYNTKVQTCKKEGQLDLKSLGGIPNMKLIWEAGWGGLKCDYSRGLAMDLNGNFYCIGSTESFSKGGYDWALVKFYQNGTKAWNLTWGGLGDDWGYKLVLDITGNIYCVGSTESFSMGGSDLALLKFYPDGTLAWNESWGGALNEKGYGIALDTSGNLFCVGSTESFSMGGSDLALLKFYPNGTLAWNESWGGALNEDGYGITLDAMGNIYCVGDTESFSIGEYDVALVKFYSNGTMAWNVTWGSSRWDGTDLTDVAVDIVLDTEGNIYCGGQKDRFTGPGSNWDLLLLKFDSNGTKAWEVTWDDSTLDLCNGIALDQAGNVYCVGKCEYDLLLVKFNDFGWTCSVDWYVRWNCGVYDYGCDIIVNTTEYLYYLGSPQLAGVVYDFRLFKFQLQPAIPDLYPIQPNPNTDGIVHLNWTDVSDADIYYIFRDTKSISSIKYLTSIGMSSDPNFTDTLSVYGRYYYVIVAAHTGGILPFKGGNSSISNCYSVLVAIPPQWSPLLHPIQPNPNMDSRIYLNWTKVTGATKYYIYRSITNITDLGALMPIGMSTSSNYIDWMNVNGTYYYVIVASNMAGNSSISNCENITVAIPLPTIPYLYPIQPSPSVNGRIYLNWTRIPNADKYYIYRNTVDISNISSLTPIKTTIYTNYTDNLNINGIYYYVIVASNVGGNSSASNCESITVEIPSNIPGFGSISILVVLITLITLEFINKKKKNKFICPGAAPARHLFCAFNLSRL